VLKDRYAAAARRLGRQVRDPGEQIDLDDPLLDAGPVSEVYVIMGFGCNIRCPVCPYWGDSGICFDKSLNASYHAPFDALAMDRFLGGMRQYGPRTVNLSGGEPLLSPHWTTVAGIARRHGYKRVELTTNASYLADNINAVAEHIDVLQVSFTDPAEWRRGFGEHDWVPRLHGLYDDLRAQRPDLRIVMNLALSDQAVAELSSLADVVASLPVDAFRIIHPMWFDEAVCTAHRNSLRERMGSDGAFWTGFIVPQTELDPDELMTTLTAVRAAYPKMGVFPELDADEAVPYYRDATYVARRYRGHCDAPWKQVNVAPNGDVWVCYDVPLGNIHESGAAEILNGPVARKLRRELVTNGLFGGCRGCFLKYTTAM
jgi:MoaA/NifB/PqqE/SkfB family radical SAM enzyme